MPKNIYRGDPGFQHGEIPAVGVLFVNLGTPEAPTPQALRPYLRQFLSDPRVIELPRLQWQLILNLFILTTRPKASAEAYEMIWTEDGSPLLAISQRIVEKTEAVLQREYGTPIHAALGMTYGEPSVPRAMAELQAKRCRRLVVLPMFSHYSSTSTGAVLDAVMKELMTWRRIPELRTIHQYHDEPLHIRALAASIREFWDAEGEPQKLLFSFHGIPQRYFEGGDPYHCQCHKTARLVAEELGLSKDRWVVAFQSIFGKEEWIKPTTDVTIRALAKSGLRHLDVICPGFSADCVETLEEIDVQNREFFEENGGETFRYIPCLNDRDDQIACYAELVRRNLGGGWAEPRADWNQAAVEQEAALSKSLADELIAHPPVADGGFGAVEAG